MRHCGSFWPKYSCDFLPTPSSETGDSVYFTATCRSASQKKSQNPSIKYSHAGSRLTVGSGELGAGGPLKTVTVPELLVCFHKAQATECVCLKHM